MKKVFVGQLARQLGVRPKVLTDMLHRLDDPRTTPVCGRRLVPLGMLPELRRLLRAGDARRRRQLETVEV